MSRLLGILQLENRPLTIPGSLGDARRFAYPARGRTVPGAHVDAVVAGEPWLEAAYVAGARALEADGATAIITNCGFAILYQAAMSGAVRVPVAASSLLLLPLLAATLAPGRRIGLLTYDAARLTARHLEAAGVTGADERLVVAGIEGTRSWAALAEPVPDVGVESLAADVLGAVRKLRRAHPEVAVLLLECAAFCPVSSRVRTETGLPVLDFVSLADLVMAAAPERRPEGD
ncbi:MAG TPA: hypothetical protein VFC42_01540 [Methylomirabilota bacterium]|nr:hypothetical protein [Methylomirabilota bacterium]